MKRHVVFAAAALFLVGGTLAAQGRFDPEEGAIAVSFTYGPEKPKTDNAVQFYAVFKGTPLPGTQVTWNFGDKQLVEGNPVSYVFPAGGFYPVEVQALQPRSKPLNDSQVVFVQDVKPTSDDGFESLGAVAVSFEIGKKVAYANELIQFIAVFKGTPTDDAVVRWTFAGVEELDGNPVQFSFPYSSKWLVTVTVEQRNLKPITYSEYVVIFPQRVERKWR